MAKRNRSQIHQRRVLALVLSTSVPPVLAPVLSTRVPPVLAPVLSSHALPVLAAWQGTSEAATHFVDPSRALCSVACLCFEERSFCSRRCQILNLKDDHGSRVGLVELVISFILARDSI